jgi:hypothetical protein
VDAFVTGATYIVAPVHSIQWIKVNGNGVTAT